MWSGINRRKFPRADYKCTITIKSLGEIPRIISTRTENIGMGGICVILKDNIDLFKNVELEVLLEDGSPPIRCRGSVVWVVKKGEAKHKITGFDTGIEFTDIKDADQKRIGVIVDRILARSGIKEGLP